MAKKVTTQDFIEKAKAVHGDKYDYTNVEYEKNSIKIKIICPIHNEFMQTPGNHLAGSGCSQCKFDDKRTDVNDFISKSLNVHNSEYDYSNVIYVNANTKVEIICPKHGSFFQKPFVHLNKQTKCPDCTGNRKMSKESFISKAKKLHNDVYDYSLVEFIDMFTDVKIICPKHGIVSQQPRNHLRTRGCYHCSFENNKSKPIIELKEILSSYNIESEKRFDYCRNIKTLPFDLYIQELNLCIEYDGRQHFEAIEFWGGDDAFLKTQKNDNIKNQFCKENNINLLRIRYDEDHVSVLKEYFKNNFNIEL